MSVEFKLFGELTIKQFVYVGIGGTIAYLIIASNLNFVLKLIFATIFAGGGAALALVPINNRPLDVWVTNFLAAMFSPTKRVWKKKNNPTATNIVYDKDNLLTPPVNPVTPNTGNPISPTPTNQNNPVNNQAPSMPPTRINLPVYQQVDLNKLADDQDKKDQSGTGTQPTQAQQPVQSTKQQVTSQTAPTQPIQPMQQQSVQPATGASTLADVIAAPEKPATERQTILLDLRNLQDHRAEIPGYQAKPNTIKGIVKDISGNLIAGAIVIIKQELSNQPTRAMVTNALGEFETSAPLEDGDYLIDISFQNKMLPLYKIVTDGSPIDPMVFQYKN